MFDFRVKKVLSVILSSCTLGCLSSFFAVNGEVTKVAQNTGSEFGAPEGLSLTQTTPGDLSVDCYNSSKYTLLGNSINYGQESDLLKHESGFLPGECCNFKLYVRAIKIKDAFGRDITYDPNTSNQHLDTGWIDYIGLGTFNFLRSSAGVWKTFTIRYWPDAKEGELGLKWIIRDQSRSIDHNVYNLYDKEMNPIVPDME